MQLALLQFENQHLGGEPILDIEAVRAMKFYLKPGIAAANGGYNRTIDTVLGDVSDRVWVELKSKKAPLKNSDFKLWNYRNKRGGIHKEFTADMVSLLHKRNDPLFQNPEIPELKWYFHKFRTQSGHRNPSESDLKNKMREMCKNLIKAPSKPQSKATFGISENAIKLGCENKIISRDIGQVADVESLLLRFAENNLFEEILSITELD